MSVEYDQNIMQAMKAGEVEVVCQLLKDRPEGLEEPLGTEDLVPLEQAFDFLGDSLRKIPKKKRRQLFSDLPQYHMIIQLLQMGASPDNCVFMPPLWHAVSVADFSIDLVIQMIRTSKNVDCETSMGGDTPLKLASTLYLATAVQLLLSAGADPSHRDVLDKSILWHAYDRENFDGENPCVPLLLEAGAELHPAENPSKLRNPNLKKRRRWFCG